MVLSKSILAALFGLLVPGLSDGFGAFTDVIRHQRTWQGRVALGKATHYQRPFTSTSALYMGKGFRRMKRKQLELERKLEEARRQRLESEGGEDEIPELTDEEVEERIARKRFDELLDQGIYAFVGDEKPDDVYLTDTQREEVALIPLTSPILLEGQEAPTQCFEELVHIKTGNAIGNAGRLVPWLHKSQARHKDYLVIVCHPFEQDVDMRRTMKELPRTLPEKIMKRLIFVNADTPRENRRWLKKNGLLDKISVYYDEKLNWMRAYYALETKDTHLSFFVISKGRVKKILRDAVAADAGSLIQKMIRSLEREFTLDDQ